MRRFPWLGALGGVLIAAAVAVVVAAPWTSPARPTQLDLRARLVPPAWVQGGRPVHLLGTDNVGRDVLSRVIWGSRISLSVGAAAALLGMVLGGLLGLLAGYFGRWPDAVISWLINVQLAFPFTLLAIFLLGTVGGGFGAVVVVLALATWVNYARIVRGQVLAIRAREVFQDPLAALNPLYTAGFQIAEVLRRHRGLTRPQARSGAIDLLAQVGVPDPSRRAAQYPHQSSGGMRQRVMIATVLAGQPRLLIADEPTTALDVTVQAEIVRLVCDIQARSGLGLIWVTHDLALLARIADRVLVMYAGQVVEAAPAAQLYASPRHPYTAGLLATVARLDQPRGRRARAIPGQPPLANRPVAGCAFAPRCVLRFERCAEMPPLVATGPHAVAACWRAGEPH